MHPDTAPTETVDLQSGGRMPELGRGTCIGRYVVLDRIGAGGMGVVYRAYDPDLDRRVAVKLVRDLSEDASARLVREAQALAKVSHPNIVGVYDVGTFSGSVFIAMELVEGRTLLQWFRSEKPGWRAIVKHLIDAAHGLAAAHAAGLIHRDFKPNNAIIGGDGRVRVLDFGLARVAITPTPPEVSEGPITVVDKPVDLDGPTVEDPALPHVLASRVIGTPVYMAPEQRKRGAIDARADQFAFAVTAWEMLYHERPFDADDGEAYAAAAAAHHVRPAPAKTDVPSWVRRVLVRALSPSPSDRFRSIDDLIAALEADPRARRWKIAGGAGVLGLAALGAYAIVSRGHAPGPCEGAERHLAGVWDSAARDKLGDTFQATGKAYARDTLRHVEDALDLRAKDWVDLHNGACLASRVRGEESADLLDLKMACLDRRLDEMHALIDELSGAPDDARVASALDAIAQLPDIDACNDRDALTAVMPPPADPSARERIATVRRDLDQISAQAWTGGWAQARGRAARALDDAHAIGWPPVIAEAAFTDGQVARLAGDLPASEAALFEAVDASAHAHLDALSAKAWAELVAVVGYEEARPADGLALAHAADAAAARAGSPPSILQGLDEAEALTYSGDGKLDAALDRANAALAIAEQAHGENDVETAEVLNTVAMITADRGDYAQAEKLHRRVLAIRQAALGPGHPKVGDSLDNLGVVLQHEGRTDEAKQLYEQALAVRVAALGPDHRDVGTSHNNLGSLLMDAGDDAGATTHLEAALAIYERALGPDHADLAYPLSNLGELAGRRGEWAKSMQYCKRSLALDEKARAADDPDLAYDLVCLGEAELGQNDLAAAGGDLERALALREANSVDAGELARTRFDVARVVGHTARGRELAQQAADTMATLGATWADRLAAVRRWLGTR